MSGKKTHHIVCIKLFINTYHFYLHSITLSPHQKCCKKLTNCSLALLLFRNPLSGSWSNVDVSTSVSCCLYSLLFLYFVFYFFLVFFSMLYLLYFGQHRSVGYGHAAFIVSPCSWCFAVRATVVTDTVFIYLFLIFIFL